MKLILKSLQFLIILLVLYLAVVFAFSRIGSGASTIMKIATRNPVTPGGFGFTLQRFQDIENYRDVDIVFLGSSHCYRTFDTRIYEEYGLKTFNMGTTGQSPMNTYYLLKRYFDQINPKLVIFDINYRVIDRDGLECFYDLAQNMDYFPEMMEMAFAIKSFHAINGAVSKWMLDITGTAPKFKQKERKQDFYVSGGYVEFKPDTVSAAKSYETKPVSQNAPKRKPRTVVPLKEQMDYIAKVVQYVKSRNARIVLVTKPEPAENLKAIANYEEVSRQIADLAARINVPYFDFNHISLPLNTREHFYDKEYLSPAGVQIFNPALIEMLHERNMIDWQSKTPMPEASLRY